VLILGILLLQFRNNKYLTFCEKDLYEAYSQVQVQILQRYLWRSQMTQVAILFI